MLNNRGSSLIFVLSLAIILNLVFVTVYMATAGTQKKSGVKRVNTVVLSIAEAGKEHAISLFRAGASTPVAGTKIAILSNIAFGGGFYSVICSSNVTSDTIYLRTSAVYGTGKCSTEVTFTVTGCIAPTDSAYNYGIIAGNEIDWVGSGSCNTGSSRLHCNGAFGMSGSSNFTCQTLSSSTSMNMSGSGDIYGNINTPVLNKSGSGKITGTTTIGAVPVVTIPTINLTPYYKYALTKGQVFSGKSITGSASTTVPGGVMYVNGDFNYSGSGDFYGSIIATGSVSISGSGNFIASGAYPAIFSQSGTINMSGSGNVTGLIFAQTGGIFKSGSGDVTGSIICGGSFKKSGGWNTLTYQKVIPTAPGCTGTKYVEIGWREL
jgi:hypothetical protein